MAISIFGQSWEKDWMFMVAEAQVGRMFSYTAVMEARHRAGY